MTEKLASAEIDESREHEKSTKVMLVELAEQNRLNLGQMKAVGDLLILAEARAERDTRERIAQLAREVAKEVGGQFAETHMPNTALNKFIARLERIRGVNR